MKCFTTVCLLALALPALSKPNGKGVGVAKLLRFAHGKSTEGIKDCTEPDIISCKRVDVDFDALLKSDKLRMPGGVTMEKQDRAEEDLFTDEITFEDKLGSVATLTYTPMEDRTTFPMLTGTIMAVSEDQKSQRRFLIENCGEDCHVLVEEKIHRLTGEDEVFADITAESEESEESVESEEIETAQLNRNSYGSVTPGTGYIEISVTFYYTPEFAAATGNPVEYIKNQVAITNHGYRDSKLNVRMRAHCIRQIDNVPELDDGSAMLKDFQEKTRDQGGADAAMLYISEPKSNFCGLAYTDIARYKLVGYSHGWVAKGCGGETLGHELGHIIGLTHNKEQTSKVLTDPRGHGYLMAGSPYHSIMSYSHGSNNIRVNCYSSNDLFCFGTETGTSAINARAVIERFAADLAGTNTEAASTCPAGAVRGEVHMNPTCQDDHEYCTHPSFGTICDEGDVNFRWAWFNCRKTCGRCY